MHNNCTGTIIGFPKTAKVAKYKCVRLPFKPDYVEAMIYINERGYQLPTEIKLTNKGFTVYGQIGVGHICYTAYKA